MKKGTKNNTRASEYIRTRATSLLDQDTQCQLVVDQEILADLPPSQVVAFRTDLYGDGSTENAKKRKAVRDRIHWLRSLKKANPGQYW